MDKSVSIYPKSIFGGCLMSLTDGRDQFVTKKDGNKSVHGCFAKTFVNFGVTVVALPLGLLALIEGLARTIISMITFTFAKICAKCPKVQAFHDKCFAGSLSLTGTIFIRMTKAFFMAWRCSSEITKREPGATAAPPVGGTRPPEALPKRGTGPAAGSGTTATTTTTTTTTDAAAAAAAAAGARPPVSPQQPPARTNTTTTNAAPPQQQQQTGGGSGARPPVVVQPQQPPAPTTNTTQQQQPPTRAAAGTRPAVVAQPQQPPAVALPQQAMQRSASTPEILTVNNTTGVVGAHSSSAASVDTAPQASGGTSRTSSDSMRLPAEGTASIVMLPNDHQLLASVKAFSDSEDKTVGNLEAILNQYGFSEIESLWNNILVEPTICGSEENKGRQLMIRDLISMYRAGTLIEGEMAEHNLEVQEALNMLAGAFYEGTQWTSGGIERNADTRAAARDAMTRGQLKEALEVFWPLFAKSGLGAANRKRTGRANAQLKACPALVNAFQLIYSVASSRSDSANNPCFGVLVRCLTRRVLRQQRGGDSTAFSSSSAPPVAATTTTTTTAAAQQQPPVAAATALRS